MLEFFDAEVTNSLTDKLLWKVVERGSGFCCWIRRLDGARCGAFAGGMRLLTEPPLQVGLSGTIHCGGKSM